MSGFLLSFEAATRHSTLSLVAMNMFMQLATKHDPIDTSLIAFCVALALQQAFGAVIEGTNPAKRKLIYTALEFLGWDVALLLMPTWSAHNGDVMPRIIAICIVCRVVVLSLLAVQLARKQLGSTESETAQRDAKTE